VGWIITALGWRAIGLRRFGTGFRQHHLAAVVEHESLDGNAEQVLNLVFDNDREK